MIELAIVILLVLAYSLGLVTLTALNLRRDLMDERAETQKWRAAARHYEKRYDEKSKEAES